MTLLRAASASLLAVQLLGAAGTIVSGAVHDEAGGVLKATPLLELKAAHTPLHSIPFTTAVTVAPDGTFKSPPIPAGEYYVCAYPGTGYLSNCEWQPVVTTIKIGDGIPAPNVEVTVVKGTLIQVYVDDPGRLINPVPAIQTDKNAHHFYPGVITSTGYYRAARYVTEVGTRKSYAVTIPKSSVVNLFVDTDLVVSGANGQALALRSASSIAVAGGPDSVSVIVAVQ